MGSIPTLGSIERPGRQAFKLAGSLRHAAAGQGARTGTGRSPSTPAETRSPAKRVRVVRGVQGGKRDAERALNQLVTDVSSGRATAPTATFADLLDRWLDNVGSALSPRTLQGYRRVVAQRLVPAFGAIKLNKLSAAHLDRLYRSLSAEGLAPASVRAVHAVLSSALNQAVRWGWIGENVADRATPPPSRRPRLEPPDPATVHQVDRGRQAWIELAHRPGIERHLTTTLADIVGTPSMDRRPRVARHTDPVEVPAARQTIGIER